METKAKIKNYKTLSALCFAGLFLFGWTDILRASAIPKISVEFAVSDSLISLMLFICTLCAVVGIMLGSKIITKYGYKTVITLGFSLLLAGSVCLLFVPPPNFIMLILAYMLTNFGFGFIDGGINSLGGRIFVSSTALMVNIMHFCFGMGSTFGSLVGGSVAASAVRWPYSYLTSVVMAVLLLIFVLSIKFPPSQTITNGKAVVHKLFTRKLLTLAITAGMCVVLQVIIGSWLVNLLVKGENWSAQAAAGYLMLFFIMFTLSRMIAGIFAKKIGYFKTIYIGLIGAIILFSIGLLTRTYILLPLSGLFVGCGLPTVLAIAIKEYPVANAPVISFIMATGGIVNMTLTQTVGVANDLVGIKNGIGIFVLFAVTAMVLLTSVRKQLDCVKRGDIR